MSMYGFGPSHWRDPDDGRWYIVVNETQWKILQELGWDMNGYIISRPIPTDSASEGLK
jgi:hypothetical protein